MDESEADLTPGAPSPNIPLGGCVMAELERRRQAAGLSYEALGEALGISKGHARDLCLGRHAVRPELVARIVELWPDLTDDEVTLATGKLPEWAQELARDKPRKVLKALTKIRDA